MPGDLEEPDPTRLRVSDADRHRVADVLREAAGDGRIDLDELDERLAATYAARTYADLVPITHDLPSKRDQPTAPAGRRHLAILSGVDRTGVWVVPEQMTVLALMGGANLDLRQAKFAAQEVVLTVHAIMGGASVIVGPHTNVVIEGAGIMGGYAGPSGLVAAQLDETSPTVRIRGVAFWGGVSVERKHVPGSGR
ncbi:MAG: DUF1707 domain-containing protein [Actinomycetota bacterium]|nr:DUF1707 domain-containing protein [Actinomycetota bacterium]